MIGEQSAASLFMLFPRSSSCSFCLAYGLLAFSLATGANASPAVVGDLKSPAKVQAAVAPHTMEELRGLIATGLKSGKQSIVIPPGVYKGAPEKRAKAHLLISGVSGVERKSDSPFMWDSKAEVRAGGVVRIHSKKAAEFAKVGDLASMGGDDPSAPASKPHTLLLEECEAMTLRNVSVYSSNCMGIIASGGEGGHRFIGCRVVPGPPPAGATEERLLSTDADAMLITNLRKGVLTENCEIRDAGDDSWSVASRFLIIVKREKETLWIANSQGFQGIQAGDCLQAALEGPIGTVVSATNILAREVTLDPQIVQKINAETPWGYWRLKCLLPEGRLWKVVLKSETPWQQGDSIYNIDRQGNGFVFRNNKVRSSGRIQIRASGIVEGNRIEGSFCISGLPDLPYPAAAGIESIVIRDNTIIDAHLCNPFRNSSQAGAISLTDDGPDQNLRAPGAYGKVIIENNIIRGGNGAGIVVSSARNVVIRNNRLEDLLHIPPNNTGEAWSIDNHAAVWLACCDTVTLSNNLLLNPGKEISQPLVVGAGVKKLEGSLSISTGTVDPKKLITE